MAVGRINKVFSNKKTYERFAGAEKVAVITKGRINEVTVRQGSTAVVFKNIVFCFFLLLLLFFFFMSFCLQAPQNCAALRK